MRKLIRKLRIPRLYFELGIIVLGAFLTGLAIWIFDALPFLVNWLWFLAGAVFGVLLLCILVVFFAFGARGEGPIDIEEVKSEFRQKPKAKPRLVQNGKSHSD